ncbi:hypothetical protein SAMN04515620_10262 [Collimonas sp. OK607]|uniref:hypothetical protein n=1 Tax=Collimonas sp. OK607 TaxID=1798194 RepID=UPI0008E6D505|nr:hypothetical protein [Collimonas sp. OK607]SFA74382.1 hypothetical protein SAMN04515620_10262 [Collimonas sp. OK607]
MKEFRQLLRKRFLYDEVGREKRILILVAIVWSSALMVSLAAGVELWLHGERDSAKFQFFLLGAIACVAVYWLCFAKDGLVRAGEVKLVVNIDERHHKKLRRLAAQQDTTIGDIVEQLMDIVTNARLIELKSSGEAAKNNETTPDLLMLKPGKGRTTQSIKPGSGRHFSTPRATPRFKAKTRNARDRGFLC